MTTQARHFDFTHVRTLSAFIGTDQLKTMVELSLGEEGEHYTDKLKEYAERVEAMPRVYEQDGKGMEAIAYLHYFTGGCDWWITEADTEEPMIGFSDTPQPNRRLSEQLQTFGLADMGEPELGYISIKEIIENGAELDLYWEPKTLRDALKK